MDIQLFQHIPVLFELELLQVRPGSSLFAAANNLREGCSLVLGLGSMEKIQGVVGGGVAVHAGDLLAAKAGRTDVLELDEVKIGLGGVGKGL